MAKIEKKINILKKNEELEGSKTYKALQLFKSQRLAQASDKKGLKNEFFSPFHLGEVLVWENKHLPRINYCIEVINHFNTVQEDGLLLYIIDYDGKKPTELQQLRGFFTKKKELFEEGVTPPSQTKEKTLKSVYKKIKSLSEFNSDNDFIKELRELVSKYKNLAD